MNPKDRSFTSVSNYIATVEKIKADNEAAGNKADLLFRGQTIDKPLLPKIARYEPNGDIRNIEKLVLKEFRRGILPLSEFQPSSEWDLLALAQHHGLPTRLLDWTYSALVALWFAVSVTDAAKIRKNQNGVVWILSPEVKDFLMDDDQESPYANGITKIFRGNIVSRRISAQAGLFTAHKIIRGVKVIPLESNGIYSRKLTKILIPSEKFRSIRLQLNTLGINQATIYPDLDGFCAHLGWRYFKK